MTRRDDIVFGPWVGEFGWELARWVPACRYIASKHNGKKYAIGPIGHKIIYEFVDKYIEFDKDFRYYSCMQNAAYDKDKYQKYIDLAVSLGTIISPHTIGPNRPFKILPKKFTGTKHDDIRQIISGRKLICVFPRQRVHDKNRNWPISNWVHIIKYYCENGYHVMAFGGPEDHKLPYSNEFFTDYIEYNGSDELDVAISALNLSKLSVAIQSGGIYLGLYAANTSVAFGIAKHVNRLKSEDHLKSRYKYIITKDFSFTPQFAIASLAPYLR